MATAKTDTGELFLSRLSETYVCRPGENVLLECYVRHQRVKSIIWYANGELVELRGFRLWHRYQPRTGQCMLYLRSVLYSDEGLYCCEATGTDGVVETLEIKLKIENYDKAWTKIPVLHMAGRVMPEDLDQPPTLFLTTSNSKSEIDETMLPMHWYELRVDRPLLDPSHCLEHTSLQLSCRIAGLHIDKFEWFRNGELVAVCLETPPSSLVTTSIIGDVDRGSFHASYDTLPAHFIALLTVDQTTQQRHDGRYECHASNAHFQISSSCQVIIQQVEGEPQFSEIYPPAEAISLSPPPMDPRKRTGDDQQEQIVSVESKRPRLTTDTTDDDEEIALRRQQQQQQQLLTTSPVESRFRTLGDQLVPAGDSKKDLAKSVTWSEQLQTVQEKDSSVEMDTLLPPIPEVIPSSSDESSSASGGELEQLLRSHSLVSTSPPLMMTTAAAAAERILDLSTTSSSSDMSIELPGMCPVFFQLLPSSLQCEEGERLLLSCQVMAGTQCQIRWLTNEKVISENTSRTRRHYNPDTGICFIIIDPTLTTDSGLYRLIIANRNGQAQSTCQVLIQPRQLPAMPADELSTRLSFVKSLPSTPVVCRDGDTMQLTCVVHGRRPIQIRWFKDEQLIIVDEKQQHTRQTYFDVLTGKSTLTIHDIYPGDSGVYRCEASNVQGRESTSTTLDVSHVQYDVDSEMSSASFASGPPSDHEDMPGSQSYPSFDDKALYEESRRLVADLDARIAELSSEHTTATVEDDQQHRSQHGKLDLSVCLKEERVSLKLSVLDDHRSIGYSEDNCLLTSSTLAAH